VEQSIIKIVQKTLRTAPQFPYNHAPQVVLQVQSNEAIYRTPQNHTQNMKLQAWTGFCTCNNFGQWLWGML
jgi:hypothetical protein